MLAEVGALLTDATCPRARSTGVGPCGRCAKGRTCSPVSTFLASLTLPILPAPIVLPSAHVPVAGAVMVVLRLLTGCCCTVRASTATPLMGIAEAVDASDAYREWLRLLESGREGSSEWREGGWWSWARLDCSWSRRVTLFRAGW